MLSAPCRSDLPLGVIAPTEMARGSHTLPRMTVLYFATHRSGFLLDPNGRIGSITPGSRSAPCTPICPARRCSSARAAAWSYTNFGFSLLGRACCCEPTTSPSARQPPRRARRSCRLVNSLVIKPHIGTTEGRDRDPTARRAVPYSGPGTRAAYWRLRRGARPRGRTDRLDLGHGPVPARRTWGTGPRRWSSS